jgi:hypothetical protein
MKHALLVLVVLVAVCVTASAQQNDPNLLKNQQALVGAVLMEGAPTGREQRETVRGNNGDPDPTSQEPKPAEDQKKKIPPVNQSPVEIKRPPIDASMVGYIDNAIVISEVRIRFDAAFNDAFPDRAEFVYAKCGCYRNAPVPGYDPNASGPGPGIPKNVNFQVLSFMGEYAFNRRFSGFLEIPIRWIQPQGAAPPFSAPAFPNGGGISDVQAGLKFAILASSRHYLTAQFLSYFPSGAPRSGLGTNHYSVEPALLYYQRLSDRFAIEGELGGWIPIGGSAGVPTTSSQGFAGNLLFYGVGPSYNLITGERFRVAPVIELVGWNVTGGLQTGAGAPSNAGGTNIVNLKIGARLGFGTHNSLYIGYGKALTSADWYNEIVRVEYRYSF